MAILRLCFGLHSQGSLGRYSWSYQNAQADGEREEYGRENTSGKFECICERGINSGNTVAG